MIIGIMGYETYFASINFKSIFREEILLGWIKYLIPLVLHLYFKIRI